MEEKKKVKKKKGKASQKLTERKKPGCSWLRPEMVIRNLGFYS